MSQDFISDLKNLGVNYEETLSRLMDMEDLYEQLLGMFVEDTSFNSMCKAIKAENSEDAYFYGHTLKGVIMNIGLDGALKDFLPAFEPLREGNLSPLKDKLPILAKEYDGIITTIKRHT